jgi:hypothetical protein
VKDKRTGLYMTKRHKDKPVGQVTTRSPKRAVSVPFSSAFNLSHNRIRRPAAMLSLLVMAGTSSRT